MRLLFLIIGLAASTVAHTTHLKGGYIRIEPTLGLTYKIIVVAYTSDTHMAFGGDDSILDFGDGTSVVVAEQHSTTAENGLFMAQYEVLHTYSSSGKYIVSYSEPNRSEGIINITNSVSTIFYLESGFVADPMIPYASPTLLNYPIFSVPAGDNFSFAVNAVDPNDHDLFFAFANPKFSSEFKLPTTAALHGKTGLMEWDTKFNGQISPGEFLFNIKVKQIKDNIEVGYLIIDFSIVVFPSGDQLIFTKDPSDDYFVVEENGRRTWKAIAYDADASQFPSIQLTSEISQHLVFDTYDSIAGGRKMTVARVEFVHTPQLTRKEPYLISLRARVENPVHLQRDISIAVFTQEPGVITSNPLESLSDQQAMIFPNPYRDALHVSTTSGKDVRVLLHGVDNRIYFDGCASTLKNFKADNAPSILIYQILTDKGVFTGRLVRE
jgi:hypothetical protein